MCLSLLRELNEINRKHIHDSVALIQGVSAHPAFQRTFYFTFKIITFAFTRHPPFHPLTFFHCAVLSPGSLLPHHQLPPLNLTSTLFWHVPVHPYLIFLLSSPSVSSPPAGGGSEQEAGETDPEAARGAAEYRRGVSTGEIVDTTRQIK